MKQTIEEVPGGTVTYIKKCVCDRPEAHKYPDGAIFTCMHCGSELVKTSFFDQREGRADHYWMGVQT